MTREEDEEKKVKVSFYKVGVDIYNGYKISKDGLSREEDVEVLRAQPTEDDRGRNVGWRVFRRIFGGEKEDGSGSEPPA